MIESDASGTVIEGNVVIGEGSRVINCMIKNTASEPLVIGRGTELVTCHIVNDPKLRKQWSYFREFVGGCTTKIGADVELSHTTVINSSVGDGSRGSHGYIEFSKIGADNELRRFANLTLTVTGRRVTVGSEVSKSALGDGFVSEHVSSYLSLIAPTSWPIIDSQGIYRELEGIPNVTNIGAGTVFANYSGELKGQGPVSAWEYEKGAAFVWDAFTCINSKIINRYGKPNSDLTYLDLMRRNDITILGFSSFLENKVTGRIPAFSLAGSTGVSASHHRIGWVLESKPALLITFIRNTLDCMGPDGIAAVNELIPGAIRLEVTLLQEELLNPDRLHSEQQIRDGLRIFQDNLDGRWFVSGSMELPNLR